MGIYGKCGRKSGIVWGKHHKSGKKEMKMLKI